MSEDVLLNRLKAGISTRQRDQSHLITGSFDEVVIRLSRASIAQLIRGQVPETCEQPGIEGREETESRFANFFCHRCGRRGHNARRCVRKRHEGKVKRDPHRAVAFQQPAAELPVKTSFLMSW